MTKYKAGKIANNRSLIDIVFDTEISLFVINIVEYGEGGTGSKNSVSFYMQIDKMHLLAEDIINLRFKNNWKDDKEMYFIAGRDKARDLLFTIARDKNSNIVIKARIREGERVKSVKATKFDTTKQITQAGTQQQLNDIRRLMLSTKELINSLPFELKFPPIVYDKK
jgi:hypothetical protein